MTGRRPPVEEPTPFRERVRDYLGSVGRALVGVTIAASIVFVVYVVVFMR